ncbi:unnamed protein product [Rotaria sordida]|uniref:Uncharacterized protein n=1 Tax=Rotaria sordida TaxID=392033 RepID=A0A819XQP2_9BILA|nr:unnamed protein product [Rotaria sordida]CAF4132649.1 unnamed protein product [Rotaria sordida]CAF4144616.1 unnamed protein product [Rotaria sordida]
MEQEAFDISLLGTGRSNHYLPLGRQPDGKQSSVCISEFRAVDIDSERILLNMAAAEIRRRYGHKKFLLHTFPQYTNLKSLE